MTTRLQKKWLIHLSAKGCGLAVEDDMNVFQMKEIVQTQMAKPEHEISFCDLNAIMAFISEYEAER